MSQDMNAVKKDQPAATGTEVNGSVASQNTNADDGASELEMELAATQEALKKSLEERDNYRQGMLKYKKGSHQNDDAGEGSGLTREEVDAIFEEKMKNSQVVELQRKNEALLQQALRERKEALLALKSKSGISNVPGGAGSTGMEKKDVRNASSGSVPVEQYFTPEQIANLESIGKQVGIKIDLNKVRENMEKRRAAQQI